MAACFVFEVFVVVVMNDYFTEAAREADAL